MKISVATLNIAIDALLGSLGIADGGRIFSYTDSSRRNAMEILMEVVKNVTVDIEESENK